MQPDPFMPFMTSCSSRFRLLGKPAPSRSSAATGSITMPEHRDRTRTLMSARVGALIIVLAVDPAIASAQRDYGALNPANDPGAEIQLLAINAALGAVTAGFSQSVRGKPVLPAMRTGALGGALAHIGKRVAVERWSGAGLLGREIGAVGHSMIRNASDGRGAADQLILPLGPGRFHIQRGPPSRRPGRPGSEW